MDKIKIGQIGVGHGHATKVGVYRESPDWEVVGIVEPDSELQRRARSNAAFEGLAWMSEDELLNVPGLKAVLVETRVRDLLDVAERCTGAGLHIHLDKPAGASLAQFKRILDTAASKHLVVQMGYMYRYNPAVVLLREFLQRGWLGEPFEIHTVMSKVVGPEQRRQLAEFPGGMMFELGCHIIDLVHGVLGPPEKVTPFVRHSSELDDGLADNMLTVLEYPRALVSVKSSGNEVEGFARRHFALCGSQGTFHMQPLDAPNVRVAFSQPQGKYQTGYQEIAIGNYRRYVADAADMARIIRGEKDADFAYEHDYQVQKTVLLASGMPI